MDRGKSATLAIVGIVAAAGGAVAGVAIAHERDPGIVVWLNDFVRTPGAAGLAAVIAACLAFYGISRQIGLGRDALGLQERATAADTWWARFEWVSDRALPAGKDDQALPLSVCINTLERLSESATLDLQKTACAGMIDVLTPRIATVDEPTSTRHTAPIDRAALVALLSYVAASEGTKAASPTAEAAVYELAVISALSTLSFPTELPPRGYDGIVDVTVEIDSTRIDVVIKNTTSHTLAARINELSLIRNTFDGDDANPVLLIVPTPVASDLAHKGKLYVFQWRSDDDTLALADLIRRIRVENPPKSWS